MENRHVTLQFLPPAQTGGSGGSGTSAPSAALTLAQVEACLTRPSFPGKESLEEALSHLDANQRQLFLQQQQQLILHQQQLLLQQQQHHSQQPHEKEAMDPGSLTLNLMQSWQAKAREPAPADTKDYGHQKSLFAVPAPVAQQLQTPIMSLGASQPGAWTHSDSTKAIPASIKADKANVARSSNGPKTKEDPSNHQLSSGSDDEEDLEDESMSVGGEERPSRKRKAGAMKGKDAVPHAMSHLMTERRRRERLNAQFLALRGVVPNITKMNKLSTLEDAINYIKSLQQKVVTLEKRIKGYENDGGTLAENPQSSISNVSSPKDGDALRKAGLQAAVFGRPREQLAVMEAERLPVDVDVKLVDSEQLMVKVECDRRKGFLSEIGAAMEAANLDVQQASVVALAHTVHVTLFTAKLAEERRGQEAHLQAGLKEFLSVPRRTLGSYGSGCRENS